MRWRPQAADAVKGAAPVASRPVAQVSPLRLRIAEIDLDIASNDAPFLEELVGRYGDCVVPGPGAAAALRCAIGRTREGFLAFDFSGAVVPDPFDSALTPFRMLRHLRGEVVDGHPKPGWKAFVRGGNRDDILIAGNRTRLLVRLDGYTRDLATDCLVAVALRAQPEILFLHAASFAIAGRGALLIGSAKSGKSSMVLALASRGHGFLGDDLAAVRCAKAELLPYPKSAGLRAGPPAEEIEARACAFRSIPGTGLDGIPRRYVRVGDMFPRSASESKPLECVFILDGFAQSARLTSYRPDLKDIQRLKVVASENVPGWGDSAGGDLMRFLRVTDLLSRVRCYLLKLGGLDESAVLIEQAMGNK